MRTEIVGFSVNVKTNTLYNYDVSGEAEVVTDYNFDADLDGRGHEMKYIEWVNIDSIINPDTGRSIINRLSKHQLILLRNNISGLVEEQINGI